MSVFYLDDYRSNTHPLNECVENFITQSFSKPNHSRILLHGIDVIIEEKVSCLFHRTKITIVWSSGHNLTGISATHYAWHIQTAKNSCLKDLEAKVKDLSIQKLIREVILKYS